MCKAEYISMKGIPKANIWSKGEEKVVYFWPAWYDVKLVFKKFLCRYVSDQVVSFQIGLFNDCKQNVEKD